ncbi:MAG: sigma54 specific transcriptional regulator, Fis family, partial [Bryobacterales bacterium]|nr:sigma54 specific transcriptional regulator, Fis family [Bryobacterales bacterium]
SQAESLLAAEKRTLEMMANGASLSEVLNDLCAAIDAHAPPATSMVCLLDGEWLLPCAGPHVPATFKTAITPWRIGPTRASCGAAAFTKQRVIVPNISEDPRWPDDARDLTLSYGFSASWSEPLIAKDGEVLGTFAMFYPEPRTPESSDLELIDAAGHIARIAIEMERSHVAVKKALGEVKNSEDRLRTIIDTIPAMAWAARLDGSAEFFNRRWLDYAGLSAEKALDWGWAVALHPEDRGRLMDYWRRLLASGETGEIEARLRRFDGEYRWFLFRAEPLRDDSGDITRWYGANTDIEDRKRAEALLAAEKRTLEMIAGGARLADILENLCDTIDAQAPNVISTVMLMDADGMRLWPAATPGLPKGWTEAISPLTIGPSAGSCGTAAALKQRVVVSDIAADPRWVNYRDVALSYGLRAAWSQPLLSKNQQVLGTFGMYYAEPRTPGDTDLRLIEAAAHIAVIAIEGERSQAALTKALDEIAKSEAELRTIIDAIPQLIVAIGTGGDFLYANQAVLEYTGLTKEEVQSERFREAFHPEDSERLRDEREAAISRGVPFEYERRVRRRDGQYRWFLAQYNPLRDERGEVVRWYATATDIDDRKQAEERTRQENFALREQIDQAFMFEEIVGSSPPLKTVLSSIVKVAPTDSTVLITGDTGTGKELIARAIHKGSQRVGHAFIAVNCASIPSSLIASELFGHEKGAFTGALQRRQGRFELAHSGTIFLDEIGELPAETQIALLRVIQERQFERVGGSRVIPIDVRIIAATNRDLTAAIAAGTFRADLFYRLNVFPIEVPPLRNRKEDIPMLVEYFVKRYAEKARKQITRIDRNTLKLCQSYHWPGNIRELQNIVERSVILCTGDTFRVDEAWLSSQDAPRPKSSGLLTETLQSYEKDLIKAALAESKGKVAGPNGAAAKLGIPRSTLDLKIKQLNIKKHDVR